MVVFDLDKMQFLAGLRDENERWLIVEGNEDKPKCKKCEGDCVCCQPVGFTKFEPAAAENETVDITEAELREFIRNEIVVQGKTSK